MIRLANLLVLFALLCGDCGEKPGVANCEQAQTPDWCLLPAIKVKQLLPGNMHILFITSADSDTLASITNLTEPTSKL